MRAASYESADPKEKVQAFYKQALGKYGDVLTCEGNEPVGKPTETSEGLTCKDNGKQKKVHVDEGDFNLDNGNLQLKAGSKRHQHIVGFEDPKAGKTRFALVTLDLPAGVGKDSD